MVFGQNLACLSCTWLPAPHRRPAPVSMPLFTPGAVFRDSMGHLCMIVSTVPGSICFAYVDNPCECLFMSYSDFGAFAASHVRLLDAQEARVTFGFISKFVRNYRSMRMSEKGRYDIGDVWSVWLGGNTVHYVVHMGRNGSHNGHDGLWFNTTTRRIGYLPIRDSLIEFYRWFEP